jgi:O-antigen ligase
VVRSPLKYSKISKLHQRLFWFLVLLAPVQLNFYFWPSWSRILGIRSDYLSLVVYLTDVLIWLILGFWVWEKLRDKSRKLKIRIKKENLYFLLLGALIFFFLNVYFAANQSVALYKLAKIIQFSLLGLYIAKNNLSLTNIRYPLSIAVIYSSGLAVAQFLKQSSLDGLFWFLGERTFTVATPGIAKAIIGGQLFLRPYATFPHPNVLAGFTLVSLILMDEAHHKFNFKKILSILTLIFGASAIAISFSRSAWVVSVFFGAYLFLKNYQKKEGSRLFAIGLSLIALGLLGLIAFYSRGFSTAEAMNLRLLLNEAALKMAGSQPLLGVGLGNFVIRLPEYWLSIGTTKFLQPVHNIYLLVMAEAGIIGIGALFWFLILTYKKILRTPRVFRSKFFTGLLAISLLGLADHYWLTLQQGQLLLTVILGLAWSKSR